MRVYEPTRGGNLHAAGPAPFGAIVYHPSRKGPVAEFDYAAEAVEYVERAKALGVKKLRIVNPQTR